MAQFKVIIAASKYTTVIAGFMLVVATLFATVLGESASVTLVVTAIVSIGLICTLGAACRIIHISNRLRGRQVGLRPPQYIAETRCPDAEETIGEANSDEAKAATPIRSAIATLGVYSLFQP